VSVIVDDVEVLALREQAQYFIGAADHLAYELILVAKG
jgi:hypothetical protein